MVIALLCLIFDIFNFYRVLLIITLRFNVSYSYLLFQIIYAYFDVGYIDMHVNNYFKKSIILDGIYVAVHLFLDAQFIFFSVWKKLNIISN